MKQKPSRLRPGFGTKLVATGLLLLLGFASRGWADYTPPAPGTRQAQPGEGIIRDEFGNDITDEDNPHVVEVRTGDYDGNGKVDRLYIYFDRSVVVYDNGDSPNGNQSNGDQDGFPA